MNALGLDIGGTAIKVAMVDGRRTHAQRLPSHTSRPSPEELAGVLRPVLAGMGAEQIGRIERVGVCLPGIFDPAGRVLTASVNHPNLVGLQLDAWLESIAPGLPRAVVVPDAYAAAVDVQATLGLPGRVLALSLGTGVGACVLDDGVPLKVSPPDAGLSSGHLGQIDLSMIDEDEPPVGRDGGRGSAEAYLGAPALEARLGKNLEAILPTLGTDDIAVRALVRLLRIGHAIYRPDWIALLGGIGMGLRPLGPRIRELVADQLTSVARPHWQLRFGEDGFHAARGAARIAAR